MTVPIAPYPTTLGGSDYRFSEALATLDPVPACDLQRVQHTRLRRRLLYGMARADGKARVMERLRSIERADAWGTPDETGNLFPAGCKMLAQLYSPEPPRPSGPRGTEPVIEAATKGGLWDLLIRGQRDTIGMREWLVRVDPVEDPTALLGYSLMYRPVFADRVVAAPRADCCDLPGYVAESVWLSLNENEAPRWYWDVWCINGPTPYHELRTDLGEGGVVVARDAVYPYYDEHDRPVLPYSLYHAERTGFLWDPYEWMEAVEGSLELIAKLTFYGHVVFKAAWSQRWSVGVEWGGDLRDEDDNHDGASRARTSVVSDPATVLVGIPSDTTEGAAQMQVGQWSPPVDPEVLIRSIAIYERRVMRAMGIEEVDVTKASADPRSGYALEVDSTKQDAMRLRFLPTFKRGDIETLRVSAAVLGSATQTPIPTVGWDLEYGPDVEEEVEATAVVGPDGKPVAAVADTALNGAQVTALVQIVSDVAAGVIPRDAAIAIAQRAFQVSAEEAANLLGSAGAGFVQTAPAAPTGGQNGGGDGSGGAPREDGGGPGRGEAGGGGGESGGSGGASGGEGGG